MRDWLIEVRHAVRVLRATPAATLVAALSVGLGIAASSTVFSWVRTILLDPLPGVRNPGRIVTLETVAPSGELIDSSYPDYRDFRDHTRALAGAIAFKERPLELGPDGATQRVWALMVSGNYFDVLGVKPALGRFFVGDEQAERPGGAPVVVLSAGFWRSRLHSDPNVVGRTLRLNRQTLTVVGVAPAEFKGTIVGLAFDVYVPLMMQGPLTGSGDWLSSRNSRPLYLFARLAPGVTIGAARSEVRAVSRRLAEEYPSSNQDLSATLLPLAEATRGAQKELGLVLKVLLAVGAMVLLIVCANVGHIQLARTVSRRREFSVRMALGASRRRLLRGQMTESLLIALLGGGVGLLATPWLTGLLSLLFPATELPLDLSGNVDGPVFGFTLLLSLVSGLLCGLLPALRGVATSASNDLRDGARVTASREALRLGGILVVPQVALALVTVTGAGLLLQSVRNARGIDPGFDPRGVLLVGLDLSGRGYTREQGLAYFERVREKAAALPGVEGVAFAEDVPLGSDGGSWEDVRVPGYVPQGSESMKIYRNLVTPGYFGVMRIALQEGRDFTQADDATAPTVVIVNSAFVRRFFGGQTALGRTVRGWGRPLTVVGVVADSRYHDLREIPQPYMYVPLHQFYGPATGVALQIRSRGDLRALQAAVQRELAAINPAVHASAAMPLFEYIAFSFARQKIAAAFLGLLAFLAVLLAALGLYGVLAYGVAQRTHEIGVRSALGARTLDILRLVVARGMRIAAIGLGLGLLASLAAGRMLGALLIDVRPADPATMVLGTALLAAVAGAACVLPARRATRVDPMVVLRSE
jgi:putative ABC transport system permease protein